MIFTRAGEVVPGFHALGNRHTPCYLLDAPRPALFDAGFAFLAQSYADGARRVLGGRSPEVLFLTHMHFDHCGGAGALKEAFPGLRIAASAEAGQILARPRARELIGRLNEEARALAPSIGLAQANEAQFLPFEVEAVLQDSDVIDLGGGLSVRVLATPGHTRDFLSYYLPERRILIASEAVGCGDRFGNITAEFVFDYDAYLTSLRRLSSLEVEVLCPGHEQVYVGEDAARFLEASLRETERFRVWVEELLAEEQGEVERVVARIKTVQWDPVPEPKQPLGAYLLSTEARVRMLAARGAEKSC
ncbi:MAG: MBL fold metallo-hydrolase [Deltaproteobacteria bacterium]|nr:MBL fold metallo-hydrolase [Deltaproteobacteria bacterium]